MSISFLLFIFACILTDLYLLHYLWKKWQISKLLPPGPWGLPFIGMLLSHSKDKNLNKTYLDYAKKYGKIFSLTYGSFNARNLLEDLDSKPGNSEIEDIYQNLGVIFSDGHEWSEQRRFALRSLRDFGFGKKSMENLVVSEAQELVKYIDSSGLKFNVEYLFNAGVLNSLWTIMTGKRFEFGDGNFERIMKLFVSSQASSAANPILFIPIFIKLMKLKVKKIAQFNAEVTKLAKDEIDEHISTFDPNECRDFIDLYLQEMEKRKGDNSSFNKEFGVENLISVILDLFVAGMETTSSTLRWCVYFLCQNPRIQRKLQDEIDRIIGKNRPPSRDDKAKMVYIEAFFSEVMRKETLLPFGVFHRVTCDIEYGGYFFPKDTVITPFLHGVHQDESHWGDPEVFRPERFLDDSGTKWVKDDHLIPFSQGKRICLGEPLARDTLFLFLTTLLQKYNFSFDPKFPVKITPKSSLLNPPDPYQVIVTPRD